MVALELLSASGRHKPEAGGFCLYLASIIRGVSSGQQEQGAGSREQGTGSREQGTGFENVFGAGNGVWWREGRMQFCRSGCACTPAFGREVAPSAVFIKNWTRSMTVASGTIRLSAIWWRCSRCWVGSGGTVGRRPMSTSQDRDMGHPLVLSSRHGPPASSWAAWGSWALGAS
jgi:hypothetical protein